jgi:hypothetical protein
MEKVCTVMNLNKTFAGKIYSAAASQPIIKYFIGASSGI